MTTRYMPEDDRVEPEARPAREAKPASGTSKRVRVTERMQMGIGDILALLLRELWLILIVFAAIFALGAAAAMSVGSNYTASASLLMQLGRDYVYIPQTGDAARGATATIEEVVQSEVEILNSTELKKRVVNKLGFKAIMPDAPQMWTPRNEVARAQAEQAAIKVLQGGFSTITAPQNNVVRLTFKHADATAAALILNTLIDEYQRYRREVFTDSTGPALEKQKADFDQKLIDTDRTYQAFLTRNNVADFQTAKTTYAKMYDTITSDMFAVDAQIAQTRSRLRTVEASLTRLNPEMSVERNLDLSIPNRVTALKQQREELLTRYLPTAQPVRDVDAQIAAHEALLASGKGITDKDHRIGVNPVYQDLMQQKYAAEAEIASLNGRRTQLKSQADAVTTKLQELLGIDAEYNRIMAERDSLQTNVVEYTRRIQENDATRALADQADDSVRVVEKASPPSKPQSLKRPILILSFLFAGFTALCAGLLRVYTRKGFVNADMASRTLDLPVLAQAPVKRGNARAA